MYNRLENNYKSGKVYNFDGFAGYIVTSDYQYPFNIDDYDGDNFGTLKDGDIVYFIENTFNFGNEVIKVAKFIVKPKMLIKK